MTLDRRYDIDWLRVITIGLLLTYHITISFQSWASMIYFPVSDRLLGGLWYPMALLNVWRIPLLFFISGMGVCFALRKRNWRQLMAERTQRIQVPYILGILAVVPLQVYIFQWQKGITAQYMPNPGHLWFLGNIFAYTLLLSPVLFYLKNKPESKWSRGLKKLMSHPLGLVLMLTAFVGECILMQPSIFEYYAMNWHGFYLGLIAFLFGFLMVYSGADFWQMIIKLRWGTLLLAASLFVLRLGIFNMKSPLYLMSLESNLWILTVFAFAYLYLNKPSKSLSYLSQAAYPIYILHLFWQFLGCWLIFSLDTPAVVRWFLLNLFVFAGCFASYELIRSIPYFRGLFGMKWRNTKQQTLTPSSQEITTH